MKGSESQHIFKYDKRKSTTNKQNKTKTQTKNLATNIRFLVFTCHSHMHKEPRPSIRIALLSLIKRKQLLFRENYTRNNFFLTSVYFSKQNILHIALKSSFPMPVYKQYVTIL